MPTSERGIMKPSPVSSRNSAPIQSSIYPGWNQQQFTHDRDFQTLIESDSTAVYFCDATGAIIYYNQQAADLWGRRPILDGTPERFCGSCRLYRSDGGLLPHDQSPMADVLAGRVSKVYDAEMQILRPDGSCVIVIANIVPLVIDGSVVGAVNSFREDPLRMRPSKRS
jgi:PAS domain-containing protein